MIEETQSHGATPAQTLSGVLQNLRDEGLLEFLGDGSYRLLNRPVDIELVDLSDEQIDSAIEKQLLRIGHVDTASEIAAARRRRGQARLRALTLRSYGHGCALCDVRDPELLVCSHIVPWADSPDARGHLSNVLCLCRFHDGLFEVGYWSLADDLRIVRRLNIESATVRALLPDALHFRTPETHPPAPQYLRDHRRRHGFGPQGPGA